MRNIFSFFACCFFLIQACNNHSAGNKITAPVAFRKAPADSAYTSAGLRPALQTYRINNSVSGIVKAKNGTEIFVPAGCFVNAEGEPVSNVEVEVIEAFSLKDFIGSGLSTLSNDKLLVSNGMIYVNARSGDETLRLSNGAALTISMPTMGPDNGFQMFTGDGSNWTIDSSMSAIGYTIPMPLDLLYPNKNFDFWICISGPQGPQEKITYMDTNIVSLTNPKYENTIIATDEFSRRIWSLREMTEWISFFTDKDFYLKDADCMHRNFNYGIWKVYYDHPNRSFRESDSIARKMYIDYFDNNEKKLLAFCDEVNTHKRNYYSNWTDTNYYFDFRERSFKEQYMGALSYFPPKNVKEVKRVNDHGVDLNAANAFRQLEQKGVDKNEINDLLTYNFRKQDEIQKLKRIKEAIAAENKLSKLYESSVFSATKMGWINCDRFFEDSTAAKAEMFVSNSSTNNLNFIDCSLVVPDLNVRLSAYPDKQGTYSFTKKEGVYTRLPIGKPAVIVGVSIQHDSLFFAYRKINIKDKLSVSLPMKLIQSKALADSLEAALN